MTNQNSKSSLFLPMGRADMQARGWEALDVLLITGDAYVDHPSFGMAVIGRVLEAAGYRVGILAQPDWTKPEAFKIMGQPRLFVGVTSGAMDSMVANYTANKKLRRDDAYAPGGVAGRRPNYATIVYTNIARQVFKGIPVIIGGIEASLRRFAHYDYWKDAVRRSILLDSKADLLVAGMGEKQILEVARRMAAGESLHAIPGTVESIGKNELSEELSSECEMLPSLNEVTDSKRRFMEMANQIEQAMAPAERKPILQPHGDRYIVEWPPEPMSTEELDAVYALPFRRRAHPSYREEIPALKPIQFSITSHRGCFGGCSFCALAMHQGKRIISRSGDSILREIAALTRHPDFKGTISDIGGPSANMYGMTGKDPNLCKNCRRASCLYPSVCKNLDTSCEALVQLLRRALGVTGLKHLYVASGIRYDLLVEADGSGPKPEAREYLKLLVDRLVGGHLSVAPEHGSERVLHWMRKPSFRQFIAFSQLFSDLSKKAGKEQYLVPYFIASFPGSTEGDMQQVKQFLQKSNWKLQQIQDFMAGPMTLAAAMYYTQLDPRTFQPIPVAKGEAQRRSQREALQGAVSPSKGGSQRGGASPRHPSAPKAKRFNKKPSRNS